MSDDAKMSFLQHLEELRQRLIKSVISIFVGMIICWFFREQILSFLLSPLYEAWNQVEGLPDPKPLNFSSMLEPFIAYLKLSAIGGLFLGAPVILYQLWKFIAPGLYPKERRLAVPFVFVSSLLFVGGSLMAYSLVFPIGFKFFLEFAAGQEIAALSSTIEIAEEEYGSSGKEPIANPVAKSKPEPRITTDADIDAGRDAGVNDAGPRKDGQDARGTPPPGTGANSSTPTSGHSPPKDDGSGWYGWLLGKLLAPDCAVFEAVRDSENPSSSVLLKLNWHVARCGEPPSLTDVVRNEVAIAPDWKESPKTTPSHRNFVARDKNLPHGTYSYGVKVPANPGFKRLAPVLMIKDYLSLAIRLLLAFGIVFELPIIISFLSLAGIVNYKQLLQFSRWFLVISVVFGALLTPPDVITQLLLALPLMVLYFLSILFAFIFGPKPDTE